MFIGRDLHMYRRALYLFGLMCAQFDAEHCVLQITPSGERYAFLYTLGISAGAFGCFIYAYLETQSLYMSVYTKTGNFYETINFRCFCLTLWLVYMCLYVRRHRHKALIQTMLQLNRICYNRTLDQQFLKFFIYYISMVIFALANYTNGFLQAGLTRIAQFFYIILYTYSFLTICLIIMFFLSLQQIIASAIAHYNMQLQRGSNLTSICIHALNKREELLNVITVELNECFGLLMLPIVPMIVMMAPTGPLFLISTVMEGKFTGYLIIVACITACLWNVPWLVMTTLIFRSNIITIEANKTAKILAKIPRTGTGLDRMVEKFLLKNLRQQPILTAYGFFALDKSTLFNLFTAIFTYMVILVQFKEMENSTKSLQKY